MKRLLATGSVALAILLTAAVTFDGTPFWPFGGHDLRNTRHAAAAVMITPENVGDLGVSWVFTTGGDVSATPSVDATSVYVPDWAGNIYSLDRGTGAVKWSAQVGDYTGVPGNTSRATPAIYGNLLIFGDQGGRQFAGARLVAVNRQTGALQWVTKVEEHPAAILTQSPIVFGNRVYVGVASMEELYASDPNYPCCTFRGSMVALDVNTGKIVWKTYTVPAIAGYSGNGVWGPTASIDPARNAVYFATGNNYTVPDAELDCVAANEGDQDAIAACLNTDNLFDAVVALDASTGAVKWVSKALPFDAWTTGCLFGSGTCTSPSGPDLDFGEGPALFTINAASGRRDVVGAGQKSGQYWVFDRDTGEVVWVTKSDPGGLLGGMIWGSATDGNRIYTANANSAFQPWSLVGGAEINYGFWSAMDANTGEILWQTPNPIPFNTNLGPTAVANGVMYACSMDQDGHMYAFDASSGEILWSFASGGSCNAGAAVVDGQVFWGSGYSFLIGFVPGAGPNDKLYAFGLQD